VSNAAVSTVRVHIHIWTGTILHVSAMVIIRYFVQLKMLKVYIKFCVILLVDVDIIIPTVVQFLTYVWSYLQYLLL